MADLVILLRAVNVGGRKLPMAELRALCAELGLERTETYIQSGNLIVGAMAAPADTTALLEAAIAARFGFAVPLIMREASAWRAHIDANPFAGDPNALPRLLHLHLASRPPPPDAPATLSPYARFGERIRIAGDGLWIDYGGGVGVSKITPSVLDRLVGTPVTARNLNTVLRLQAMIEARA